MTLHHPLNLGTLVLGKMTTSVLVLVLAGDLDLSAAAARGELQLDWSDPRPAVRTPDGVCEAVIPPHVAQEARCVEVVAADNVHVTLSSAPGFTPERARLGLVPPANVFPIDRSSRRV